MRVQKIIPAFGTLNTITLYEPDQLPEAERIKDYIQFLEQTLSVFRPESEVSRLNRLAGIRPVPVSDDTFSLIKESIRFSETSYGAFDITAGPLSSLWRRCKAENRLPSGKEKRQARKLIGSRDILMNEETHSVMLRRKGQSVDFGGIAKGYAVNRILEILKKDGVKKAMIDLGGTIAVLGRAETIGIRNPLQRTSPCFGTLRLENRCAVTSGSYERYFTLHGKRYHHILDPRTGMPSDSGLCSVTLIGTDAVKLDALATGVFILGPKKSLPLLKAEGIDAIFVLEGGQVFVSDALFAEFRFAA